MLATLSRSSAARVLEAHRDGPLSVRDLRGRLGRAAETSLRTATAQLCELGALERKGRQSAVTRLTGAGWELLAVAEALEPAGAAAPCVVRALVAGWDATVVHYLAATPRSVGELSAEITDRSYSALKSRLARLRAAGLVERDRARERGRRHVPTRRMRRAAYPLALAARWERDHLPSAPVFCARDVEAVLLLALPLIDLPREAAGRCAMAVASRRRDGPGPALAVDLVVETGKPAGRHTEDPPTATTWVMGFSDAWLDAIAAGNRAGLRVRGPEIPLASLVVDQVHRSLARETAPG